MLDLGLQRISRLVDASKLPWRAVHVAGTNGKGSVCASINAMLNHAKIPTGMFTSPHLLDRWDGITIRGRTIEEANFLDIEKQVKQRDERLKLGSTEFELLTAAAFEAFSRAKVDIGVVEVGVGGAQDATNILQNPLATVITHLSLDHRGLLGNTLKEIATHKAGIMKPGVPCFVDGNSQGGTQEVIATRGDEIECGPLKFIKATDSTYAKLWPVWQSGSLGGYQKVNQALAYEACAVVLEHTGATDLDPVRLASATVRTRLPGRNQYIDIERITGGSPTVILLDGAHNREAVAVLEQHVAAKIRKDRKTQTGPVTWVLAFTNTKDLKRMLSIMLKRKDNVVAVEFSPVAGMPWVKPYPASTVKQSARGTRSLKDVRVARNVEEALHLAAEIGHCKNIVVTGSLYLVSDVLRLLRSKGATREELGLDP